MKMTVLVSVVLAASVLLVSATASAATGNVGFGFNATDISGFPTGAATLTGGGSYNPVSGFVNSAGGFRCTSDVGQGPLAGCLAGEGVRWDTVELRRSTTFKCTGAAAEPLNGDDIAPDIAGIQNVWIQGVGCASAITNFSS